MEFEWDENKNRSNQQKHGISFETARRVFDDPLHISIQDRHGEKRWQTIGNIGNYKIVVVAHLYIDENETTIIRVISVRPASKKEERDYED